MWWKRYGKLVLAFAGGALLMWALGGFKNPVAGITSLMASNQPKTGDPCNTADTPSVKGTIQADGTCKA
jgi:hypothetical protein